MTSLAEIPRSFDRLTVFSEWTGFQRFLDGEPVPIQALDSVDWDLIKVSEGPCLVTYCDYYDWSARDLALTNLLDHTYVGLYRNEQIARERNQTLAEILEDSAVSNRWVPQVIAESELFAHTCRSEGDRHGFLPHLPSYRELLTTRCLAGMLNRDRGHYMRGRDVAWIKDGVCLFWMRVAADIDQCHWIRLFPFELNRTEPRPEATLLKEVAEAIGDDAASLYEVPLEQFRQYVTGTER